MWRILITILLAWVPDPPDQNVVAYRVYECPPGGGVCWQITEVTVPATSYKIQIDPQQEYIFVVTAVDDQDRESSPSNEAIWIPQMRGGSKRKR